MFDIVVNLGVANSTDYKGQASSVMVKQAWVSTVANVRVSGTMYGVQLLLSTSQLLPVGTCAQHYQVI